MAALARWCLRHRAVVLLLWLVALAAVGAAASVHGSAYTGHYGIPGTESGRAAQLLRNSFPERVGDSGTLVWHSDRHSVRSAPVEERMARTLERIAELPAVAQVTSPYPYGEADPQGAGSQAQRRADPQGQEGPDPQGQERPDPQGRERAGPKGHGEAAPPSSRQISQDGRTAYATITFEGPAGDLDPAEVRQVVDTARAAAGPGLEVELGGRAIALAKPETGHLAEAIGIAVAGVVLFWAFGSLAAMMLPLITALVSVGTAYLGVGLLGHVLTIADFAPMLGTLIGLGVGIDYALFIVTRHRRGLREGLTVADAAARAVATSGRAVIFAGGTVCIALLGMLIVRLDFLNGVAIAASLTVMLTVLASVTLLPALLGMIGLRALGRRERRRLAEEGPRSEPPTGLSTRWSAFVERRPRLLGALATVVMLVLALPTLFLDLGSSDQGHDPLGSTTRQAYHLIADGFGPGMNGPLALAAEIDGADDRLAFEGLPDTLRNTPGVAEVAGVGLSADGRAGVITVVPETAPAAEATSGLLERLRTDVLPEATEGSSLLVHVGGVTAGHEDLAATILGSLPLFCGVVFALGCLLLLLAFRSIAIPLKAAVMNIAAVTASFGIVVAVFQWGWGSGLLGLGGSGPIEPFLPVIMVSVLFGLSMDYQVFLLSRMYEEWLKTGDNCRSVRIGLAETGRLINSAAVIMIAVFGAFVLTGDRIIAMFGIGLAAAVALDAFVLRTLLVPALMHLLGGANWWLPGWLERWLPRLSIEAPEHLLPGSDAGPQQAVPEESGESRQLPGPRSEAEAATARRTGI